MNESEFGFKIKAILDTGLDLEPASRALLRAAREQALSGDRQVTASAEYVTAGTGDVRVRMTSVLVRVILPALILIAVAFGWERWQQETASSASQEDQLGALDADLLKSDFPIDALLDRDFHAYLKKVGERE
jgi:hypothetical protein